MATMLRRSSTAAIRLCDLLNLTAPEAVRSVHAQYLAAGAEILRTNTFNSNRLSLPRESPAYIDDLNTAGVRVAREIAAHAGRTCLVAGVLGPTPATPETPISSLIDAFYAQSATLLNAGADLFIAETIIHPATMAAFLEALERLAQTRSMWVPAIVSIAPVRTPPTAFVDTLTDYELLAMGVNCVSSSEVEPAIDFLAANTNLPLCVYPSAGLPDANGQYPNDETHVGAAIERLAKRGLLNVAGGCCGTTPGLIQRLARTLQGVPPRVCS